MDHRTVGVVLTILGLAAATQGQAQEEEPDVVKFTLDAGFASTSGNSNITTITGGQAFSDRTLGSAERLSVFLDLRGSRNRFAGISRRFEQALGVAYDVIKTEKDIVAVEGAATLVQQRGTNGVDNNFPAALAGASYLHHFTPDATFTVKGEYIPNLENGEDYRLIGEAKILAPLSGKFAIALTYLVRFDNLPEPGFQKTDKFFTTGIQISL